MSIRQIFLRSKRIAWLAYDMTSNDLFVQFQPSARDEANGQPGPTYRYRGVHPYDVFAVLFYGESHGRAFTEYVERGGYAYERIDPTEYDLHV